MCVDGSGDIYCAKCVESYKQSCIFLVFLCILVERVYGIYFIVHSFYCVLHKYWFPSCCRFEQYAFLLNNNIPEGNILINCGDFMNRGKLDEIRDFNFWLWFNKIDDRKWWSSWSFHLWTHTWFLVASFYMYNFEVFNNSKQRSCLSEILLCTTVSFSKNVQKPVTLRSAEDVTWLRQANNIEEFVIIN